MAGRRILVTGAASHLGTQLLLRLERDPDVEHVVGIDTRRPRVELGRAEFHEMDIRDSELLRMLPESGADTIVHNKIVRQPGPGMSPQQAHDVNVIGSLQLLAACERAESVRAIVIRGSAGIYGSEPAAPQFFTEEMSRLYRPRTRFQRDVAEIENYFGGYAHRNPETVCMMLRYQPTIGPTTETQITRYLSLPVVPTFLGFDPRIQLIHERDAVEALIAAARRPVRGAVNVAAPGTIGLARMIRLAGRTPVPVAAQLFPAFVAAGRRFGLPKFSPDLRRLLQHGRAVDVTRLEEEVGFAPRYSTVEAVRDFATQRRPSRLVGPLRAAAGR